MKIKLSKKYKIIALACAAVLIGLAIVGTVAAMKSSGPNFATVNPVPSPPKPKVYYSPLTGVKVSKARSKLPVTGVMIENSLPARPQSGLSQAGIVYEAIAEAGITRFLALFQADSPSNIGPIRSARPYFLRWDMGYNAPYAHVGGSPEALNDIKHWQVKDLDQFHAGNYYHRISTRWAPHNMYSSLKNLHNLEKARGWYKPSNFIGFSRKDDKPAKQPTAATINLDISEPAYNVRYQYDAKKDAYKRNMDGKPHVDANTRKQIEPKVVVALVIPYGHKSDGYHSYYKNVGSGAAYVFQDGTVTKCSWRKNSKSAALRLVDSNGQNIKLNRGQTWITALSSKGQLSYNP